MFSFGATFSSSLAFLPFCLPFCLSALPVGLACLNAKRPLHVPPCSNTTPRTRLFACPSSLPALQALALLAERADDPSSADSEPDRVLLTQHDAVFTLGTGSTLDNLRFAPDDGPFGEVVRTERGGEVTYHGPGQVCTIGVRVPAWWV